MKPAGIKVLELFAGIGACSKALKNLGVEYEIVDAVEIDKYAVKSFNAIHGTNFEPQDITKWDKDLECDLIMHGSPCQDFSVAGLGKGGDEGSGTRSSLMYETLRIVEKLKPKYVIWENVKNILSKKHIYNWECYCNRMNELGYCNWCKVMNAKDYGIPQNRERVFTVSIRKDVSDKEFIFPEPIPLERKLKDMLETNVDEKYFLTPSQLDRINNSKFNQEKTRIQEGDVAQTLCARDWKDPKCVAIGVVGEQCCRTRKLTPKECWRLMGFDDSDFEKAEKVNSNTQLYKQAGNSICVPVLEAILKNLLP